MIDRDAYLIESKLNEYSALLESQALAQEEIVYLNEEAIDAIRSILPDEIREKVDKIDKEFDENITAANQKVSELSQKVSDVETLIKSDVKKYGASLKGTSHQAVYSKGRISWDIKALDGFAVAHPELLPLRKEGEPSVSIRKI